ncbi:hypothetical protein B0H13DRAFT_2331742 [Mycena leptocephala]|nr:hypothetical protein B0H13DRAFT_2331742 [Mycena leptocephala]
MASPPRTQLRAATAASDDRLYRDHTAHDAPRDHQPATRRPDPLHICDVVYVLFTRPDAVLQSYSRHHAGAHVGPFPHHCSHATTKFPAAYATSAASLPTVTVSSAFPPCYLTPCIVGHHHPHAQRQRQNSLVAVAACIRRTRSRRFPSPVSPSMPPRTPRARCAASQPPLHHHELRVSSPQNHPTVRPGPLNASPTPRAHPYPHA